MRGPQRGAGVALVGVQARDLQLPFRVQHLLSRAHRYPASSFLTTLVAQGAAACLSLRALGHLLGVHGQSWLCFVGPSCHHEEHSDEGSAVAFSGAAPS
jgi:hypothetical protein